MNDHLSRNRELKLLNINGFLLSSAKLLLLNICVLLFNVLDNSYEEGEMEDNISHEGWKAVLNLSCSVKLAELFRYGAINLSRPLG